jgi:hypothetical protein
MQLQNCAKAALHSEHLFRTLCASTSLSRCLVLCTWLAYADEALGLFQRFVVQRQRLIGKFQCFRFTACSCSSSNFREKPIPFLSLQVVRNRIPRNFWLRTPGALRLPIETERDIVGKSNAYDEHDKTQCVS